MATLADIKKAAEANSEGKVIVSVYTDSASPAGHFGATAIILGITTVYLLEGVEGDDNAVIKGRAELASLKYLGSRKRTEFYAGSGLKGGTITISANSFEEAFAKMV